MTAVEFLIEKLDNNLDIKHSWRTKQYIEQAKEMEKEQQRQKMIDLLVWINNVSSKNPMALETENDDIVDMFLNEYYNLKAE